MDKANRRSRFYKTYANIPLGLRDQIVVVLKDNQPLSWNTARIEIDNETDKVQEILEKLDELGLLKKE